MHRLTSKPQGKEKRNVHQLLDKLTKKQFIIRAWESVRKRRKVASGIDEITIDNFESVQGSEINSILKELRSKSFIFHASWKKTIGKSSGGVRNIHIFTVRDKIVQKAIQQLLLGNRKENSLFPETFNEVAIAYIPGKRVGVVSAVEKIKQLYSQGYLYITCLDIQDFFDNISGNILYQKITKRLNTDTSINWLIKTTIDQEIYKTDNPISGVLQGAVLAPLYSNIYLSDFDQEVLKTGLVVIRYADDIAILSKSQEEAEKQKILVRSLLWRTVKMKFYPDNHPKKGPTCRCFNRFGEFLGIRYSRGPRGLTIGPTIEKINSEKQKITDVFLTKKHPTFFEKVETCNRSLEGWHRYYYDVGCHRSPMELATKQITTHYAENANRLLQKIQILNQGKRLTTEQLYELGILGPNAFKRKR